MKYAVLALALASVAACSKGKPTPYAWSLPEGWVPPVVPDDNPMSSEKVALGRYLFYDKRLSGNGTMSCSSCHQQALAFTDGLPAPTGSTGQLLPRGSMMLGNAAYNDYYGWVNPLITTLEAQMQVPMFSDEPVELGITGHEDEVLARVSVDPMYMDMFEAAFPDDSAPYTLANIIRAIACFERTMFSANSPWDRWQNGDPTAASASAQRGYTSFRGEKFDCYHCHEIPLTFASGFRTSNTPPSPLDFRNDAIYNVGGNGGYPPNNPGLMQFTGLATDEGKFRGPSLRNIMMTAPYFHDGSAATIDDAIANYTAGGRTITSGPYAGDGHTNPNRDPLVKGFTATDDELTDFKAFLASLTDDTLMTDPSLSNPFTTGASACQAPTPSCPGVVPSWSAQVSAIVDNRCATPCHSPGRVEANYPLSTYDQVLGASATMLSQVAGCLMPPPSGGSDFGSVAISPDEQALLIAWLACGAPNN